MYKLKMPHFLHVFHKKQPQKIVDLVNVHNGEPIQKAIWIVVGHLLMDLLRGFEAET